MIAPQPFLASLAQACAASDEARSVEIEASSTEVEGRSAEVEAISGGAGGGLLLLGLGLANQG